MQSRERLWTHLDGSGGFTLPPLGSLMQSSVPLHGAQRLLFPHQIFHRFIYCSVLLLALFVIRFSIYIVVGPPRHLQRRSLLKIKIFAVTVVPVTGGCQSALKRVVIVPHALYKRSRR